jgi:uncharacterized Tic20 family protein
MRRKSPDGFYPMITNTPPPSPELQPEIAPAIHTYTPKLWVRFLNLFSILLQGILIVIILFMLETLFKSGPNNRVLQLGLLCAFTPIFVYFGFAIIQLIVNTISISISSIRVTPDGIENRIWPYRHIRSRWSEVDRLGKFLFNDAIYLKSYEVIGLSLSYTWPLKVLNIFKPSIALSTYNGWPDGPLADDLKHYARQLFENKPAAEKVQASNQESGISGASRDDRLLAAFSHASILLFGFGLILPLVIYFTQKKKSAFLAFHALQAFIFQLIGNIVSFVFPLGLLGLICIPIFGAAFLGRQDIFEPLVWAMVILMVGIGGLLSLVSMAYMIYGIIGAILTYQGKDFQYVLIGKWIGKRNQTTQA